LITTVWTGEGEFQLRLCVCDTGGADTAGEDNTAVAAAGENMRPLLRRFPPPPLPPGDASE
jgi:hypothetical protein